VSWDELATKLTGTERQLVRESYFSADEIQEGMAIANEARQATAGQKVEPRPFKMNADQVKEVTESADEEASPDNEAEESTPEKAESDDAESKPTDEAAEPAEVDADGSAAEAETKSA
jgi:hypothetical protein